MVVNATRKMVKGILEVFPFFAVVNLLRIWDYCSSSAHDLSELSLLSDRERRRILYSMPSVGGMCIRFLGGIVFQVHITKRGADMKHLNLKYTDTLIQFLHACHCIRSLALFFSLSAGGSRWFLFFQPLLDMPQICGRPKLGFGPVLLRV